MPEAAVQLFTQAATSGHPGAMFALGVLYSSGGELAEDDEQAQKWFASAAKHGHEPAIEFLARATEQQRPQAT